MTDTVEHPVLGTLPVVEVWSDCHHTKTGWRAKRQSDGAVIDIVYDPDAAQYYRPGEAPIARMPENNLMFSRDAQGRFLGAIRIERRVRQVR